MTDLPAIANLLVGFGVSSVLVALIGGFFNRSTRKGDYTRALVQASGELADRADKRAEAFEAKLAAKESVVDRCIERVWKLMGLLRQALPYVEEAGNTALAARMVSALEAGTPSADPSGPVV